MRKYLLLILFAPFFAAGQTDARDSSGSTPLVIDPSAVSRDIYNGQEHLGYLPSISGTAYYLSNEWQPGTIDYRNVHYPSVDLKFDLVQNEVIIRHFNGYTAITLFTPRVERFSISGQNFVRITDNDPTHLPAGIYQEVTKGKISFYIKRSKSIQESLLASGVERRFTEADAYYAVRDGIAHPIKREKQMLELVREKRTEIKNHLKQKGLSFRDNPEAVLTEIVTYFNHASN